MDYNPFLGTYTPKFQGLTNTTITSGSLLTPSLQSTGNKAILISHDGTNQTEFIDGKLHINEVTGAQRKSYCFVGGNLKVDNSLGTNNIGGDPDDREALYVKQPQGSGKPAVHVECGTSGSKTLMEFKKIGRAHV